MTRDAIAALFSRLWERLEMAWSSIADKATSWAQGVVSSVWTRLGRPVSEWPSQKTDTLDDPGFNDPSAWSIWGSKVEITGGQHVCTSAKSIVTVEVNPTVAVVGAKYSVTVKCASTEITPVSSKVSYGAAVAWDSKIDGVGTHTKVVTATVAQGLVIRAGNGPSGYSGALDSVNVIAAWPSVAGQSTAWA